MQPLASVDPEGAHLTQCLCNAGMDLKLGLHQTPLLSLNNKWGELMPEAMKKMQHLASVGPSFEPSHHFICAILFCLLILPC